MIRQRKWQILSAIKLLGRGIGDEALVTFPRQMLFLLLPIPGHLLPRSLQNESKGAFDRSLFPDQSQTFTVV